MKIIVVTTVALILTACGGNSRQALPPELLGDPPVNNEPRAISNSGTGLPFDPNFVPPAESAAEDSNIVAEVVETSTPTPAPVVAENCQALTADLETSFADINFCDTNSDCAVAEGSCPFGCYLFHNAKIDFEDYQPALEAYQSGCNPCEYQCAEAPRVADRRCVEGRCVDVRFMDN